MADDMPFLWPEDAVFVHVVSEVPDADGEHVRLKSRAMTRGITTADAVYLMREMADHLEASGEMTLLRPEKPEGGEG